jgi:hypothetical protein
MEKQELAKLEVKIREVAGRLSGLGAKGEGQKEAALADTGSLMGLLQIIHRPGWTTPAEFVFVNGILDSMLVHAQTLTTLQHTLLAGSVVVGAAR